VEVSKKQLNNTARTAFIIGLVIILYGRLLLREAVSPLYGLFVPVAYVAFIIFAYKTYSLAKAISKNDPRVRPWIWGAIMSFGALAGMAVLVQVILGIEKLLTPAT
jgi:hypothetical protein